MNTPSQNTSPHEPHPDGESVVMPKRTAAPLVLSTGLAVAALGVAFGLTFIIVGAVLFAIGLRMWVVELQPGEGHLHEPLVAASARPAQVRPRTGQVAELHPGAPGYRFRLPEKVHPLSAGVKGGAVGGLLMPIPALLYGLLSGHGIWYPINLLAATVRPGLDALSVQQLETFRLDLLIISSAIHVIMSLVIGLIYGVLMPTLPSIPKPLAWGGMLMPILWTVVMYLTLGAVNPLLNLGVDWLWLIFSQFVFGIAAAIFVQRKIHLRPVIAGIQGGLFGGLLMPIPALAWAWSTGRTPWYPANLLAAMAHTEMRSLPPRELGVFHADWLFSAIVIHILISIACGVIYGLALPHAPRIPAPLAWGGMVLPVVWTGISYSLMQVVNPLMEQRVDWPWFVVSQFIFGIVAAVVVLRSEMVHIAPAGQGPEADREAATKWLRA